MTNIPDIPAEGGGSKRADHVRSIALQVRTLIESIDGFTFLTREEMRRLNSSASVSDEMMEVVARAIDSRPTFAAASQVKAETLRFTVEDTQAIRGLMAELDRLNRGCRHTVKKLRSVCGTEALRVYAIAQKVTRPRDAEDGATWVEQMRHAMHRPSTARRKPVDPEAARKKAVQRPAGNTPLLLPAASEIPSTTPEFKAGKDL